MHEGAEAVCGAIVYVVYESALCFTVFICSRVSIPAALVSHSSNEASSLAQITSPLIHYLTHCMESQLTQRSTTLIGNYFLKGKHCLWWSPLIWGTMLTQWHFCRSLKKENSVLMPLFCFFVCTMTTTTTDGWWIPECSLSLTNVAPLYTAWMISFILSSKGSLKFCPHFSFFSWWLYEYLACLFIGIYS